VYALREADENRHWYERIVREVDFVETELHRVVADQLSCEGDMPAWTHVRRGGINLLKRAALAIGIAPMELAYYLRYRRKGRFIDQWRRKIGLRELK
jgi:hypothetical protein